MPPSTRTIHWRASLLLFSAYACAAPSADEVETTKLITLDAAPVDPGRTELEFGFVRGRAEQYYDESGARVDRERAAAQTFLVSGTRGLATDLDLTVVLGVVDDVLDPDDELAELTGTLASSVRWRFFETRDGQVSIAWLPGFSSPEAAKGASPLGLARDYWSLDNVVALTWIPGRFNGSFDVGFLLPLGNATYVTPPVEEDQRVSTVGTVLSNVGVGWQWTRHFQPIAELNFAYDLLGSEVEDSAFLALTLGAVFNASQAVRLDVGAQQALAGRNRERTASLLLNVSVTL